MGNSLLGTGGGLQLMQQYCHTVCGCVAIALYLNPPQVYETNGVGGNNHKNVLQCNIFIQKVDALASVKTI